MKFLEKYKSLDLNKVDSRPALLLKGISCEEFMSKDLDLTAIGVVEAVPMVNKVTKEQYKLTKLIFNDKESKLNILNGGKVQIGYVVYKVEDFKKQPIQCFKCKKFGHVAAKCEGNETCGKCGGEHNQSGCDKDELKCPNCGLEHTAFSRGCTAFKEAKNVWEERARRREEQKLGKSGGNNGKGAQEGFYRVHSEEVRGNNNSNINTEILRGLREIKKEIGEMSGKISEMERGIALANIEMNKFKEEVKSEIEVNAKKSFFFCLDIVKVVFPHVFDREIDTNGYDDRINQLTKLYNNKFNMGKINSGEFVEKMNNNDNPKETRVEKSTSINVQATHNMQPTLTSMAANLGGSSGGLLGVNKYFNINNGTRINATQQIVKNGVKVIVIPNK